MRAEVANHTVDKGAGLSCIVLDTIARDGDVRYLEAAFAAADQALFTTRVPTRSPEAFHAWLDHRLHESFPDFRMVRMLGDDHAVATIGFVHNYDLSIADGHCKIVAYVDPQHRGAGLGVRAAVLFVGDLFDRYPLRKVYATVYGYNEESLKSCLAAGFTEEGILRDYRFDRGTWHDLHVLSLTRADFDAKLGKAWNLWRR